MAMVGTECDLCAPFVKDSPVCPTRPEVSGEDSGPRLDLETRENLLSGEDRANAQRIREQVHRAQTAVTSLRNTMRRNSPAMVDKKLVS